MSVQYTPSLRDPRLQWGPAHQSSPGACDSVQPGIAVKERAPSPPEQQPGAADSLGTAPQGIGPRHTPAAGPSGVLEGRKQQDQGFREPDAAGASAEKRACHRPSAYNHAQRPPPLLSSVRQSHEQPPNGEVSVETPRASASGSPSGQPYGAMGLLTATKTCEPAEAAPSSAPGPLSVALVLASPSGSEQPPGRVSNALQILPPTADRRPEERTFGGRFKRPIGAATLALPHSPPRHDVR